MSNFWLHPVRQWRTPKLTLRMRLALSSAMMLLTLTVGLVLFINVSATVAVPYSETAALPLPDIPVVDWQPGQPTPTPMLLGDASYGPLNAAGYESIRQTTLGQLRTISALGLALIAIVGGIGAYWIAGRALRPLTEVSQTARHVSASTLDTRLALKDAPDDEIKELAEAFDTMLDRLKRAFDEQGRFVSDAAHELRTPLTTLRTNIEVTYSDPDATLDDYKEIAPVLERTLARLEQLVSDLLIMATEEGSLVYGEVALKPLVEDVLHDLKPVADQQQVKLNLAGDSEVTVHGHGPLLARAFSNLVENGIRYDATGGEVEVTVHRASGCAMVTVSDTGIGIPMEEQSNIFNRFYRVDRSRSRHKGGAGLGLSIVAHIAQLHGGQIRVESTPGIGSKFTLQLPL